MKLMKSALVLLLCVVVVFTPLLMACESNPDWQEQFDIGLRYLEEGRYEEAILAFTAVIEINPKFADAYRLRALAYEEAAQLQEDEAVAEEYREKAREDREKARELDPEPLVTTAATNEVTEPPTTTAVTETAPVTTQETTMETTVETTAETRYSGGRETEEYEDYMPSFTLPEPSFGTGLEILPTVTFPVFDPDNFITSEPTEAATAATEAQPEETDPYLEAVDPEPAASEDPVPEEPESVPIEETIAEEVVAEVDEPESTAGNEAGIVE